MNDGNGDSFGSDADGGETPPRTAGSSVNSAGENEPGGRIESAQEVIDKHMKDLLLHLRVEGTLDYHREVMIEQRGVDQWDIPTLLNKFEKCGIVVPEHITQDSFETVWDSHTQERENRKDTIILRVKQDVEDYDRFTSSPIQVYQLLANGKELPAEDGSTMNEESNTSKGDQNSRILDGSSPVISAATPNESESSLAQSFTI